MTRLISQGILSIKFLQNSADILRIETNLIASHRAGIFGRCFFCFQKILIGLKSGLSPGPLEE